MTSVHGCYSQYIHVSGAPIAYTVPGICSHRVNEFKWEIFAEVELLIWQTFLRHFLSSALSIGQKMFQSFDEWQMDGWMCRLFENWTSKSFVWNAIFGFDNWQITLLQILNTYLVSIDFLDGPVIALHICYITYNM